MSEPSLAALLCRDRTRNPDALQYADPETGERMWAPITSDYARVWLEWGLDQAEYHANWGV